MTTLAFERCRNCFVLVQNEHQASDDEWARWIDFALQGGAGAVALMRVLVFSAGGSPTPKQRKLIHELTPSSGSGVCTAIVIGSRVGRAVVGAMALFNKNVRAFAPDQLRQAFDHLGIASATRPELLGVATRLHRELGLPFAARP